MSEESFEPGQHVRRKADARVLLCLKQVEERPGRYLCSWREKGTPRQAEYNHSELEPFQFAGIIGVRTGAHDRADDNE